MPQPTPPPESLLAGEAEAGSRIDRLLATRLGMPRNQIQRWLAAGRVALDGRPARPSEIVRAGQRIAWEPLPPAPSGIEPEPAELALLHLDDELIAVDKPAGIAVHPGAGRSTGTLVHHLLARFPELAGVGGPGRPGIVHRLDLGTSGLLLVARSASAYQALARAFAERRVEKWYLALVYGAQKEDRLEIDLPIGRHPVERKRMAVVARGRPARTEALRIASGPPLSLLAVRIATGRTHQIRVHLRQVGLPIVGDPVYGEARWRGLPGGAPRSALERFARPALHAWRLELAHPRDGRPLRLEAPPPADLRDLWEVATGTPWPALPEL
ncbi:MAG TPA: RluA family pseudouridine synthase [Thermoanaerobaculia bacterium]|nr:RluA family pseudouridine synthase [Thermoanaerobaculia bacterium]